MKRTEYNLQHLKKLFNRKKCYTIEELSQKISYSIVSIRRFLKTLGYYSSFTHNSRWYTLSTIPEFSNRGLWFHQEIGFSKHGSLKKTILHFIDKSPQGLTAKDISNILSVPCHPVLNQMYNKGQIDRFKTLQGFVYLSIEGEKMKDQFNRLQHKLPAKKTRKLTPQAAVYVLVEYIKQPNSSFIELSKAVKKKKIIASSEAIAKFFEEHDLKKIPI